MTEAIITLQDLGKVYHLYDKHSYRLKEVFHPFRKVYHKNFHALDKVNLMIFKGETIGIIGNNGAGKSTLLKILTGVVSPTTGKLNVKGKVASLLELGAGFNPEMTGLENIYLNATIMGSSVKEISKKLPDIVSFSGLSQDFLNQPVKFYSSGMFARLAFSIAINVEPDILIIDEALSVGDPAFQLKCFEKFRELQRANITILFVTHSLESIIQFCTRAIVLNQGQIVEDASPRIAVDTFKKIMVNQFDSKNSMSPNMAMKYFDYHRASNLNVEALKYGNNKVIIKDAGVLVANKVAATIENDQNFTIYMSIEFLEDLTDPIFAFTIKDLKGLEITGINTAQSNIITGSFKKGQNITVKFTQTANLRQGKYTISFGCINLINGEIIVNQRIYDALFVNVVGEKQFVGFYDLHSCIYIEGGNS